VNVYGAFHTLLFLALVTDEHWGLWWVLVLCSGQLTAYRSVHRIMVSLGKRLDLRLSQRWLWRIRSSWF
jgi:hypothetical protein